jgi:type IV secretion system protein TrbL
LAPTDVLVRGLNITGNLLSGAADSGWMGNFGTALALVFAALLAFLAFLGLTVQLVVTLVESYLVVGAGFIFLGFGGSRWTAPYVERYISLAVSTGVKIMVLYLLMGAGLTLTDGWVAAATAIPSGPEPAVDALDIAASSVLLLMICWNAPKFTAGILGGAPAFTGGDAVGTAGALAQGALLAGTAVAGGVALGAKMLAAKGGMSAGQAAGMGAGAASAGGSSGASGAGGAGSGGSAPKPSGGGNGGTPSAGNGGGQVAPPTKNGSNGGGEQTKSTQASAEKSTSTPPPPEKAPDPTPAPSNAPSRSAQVADRGKRVAKGFASSTAFVRATQGAVPSDHAPHVAPPPLNTSGDSE